MKKIVYLLLLLCGLILFASCGSTVPDTTMAAVTTEEVPNATTPITTVPTTTPVTTTETPTTTEASDDKWKDKVDWGYDFPTDVVMDEESGKYKVGIKVYDRQGVGEKNALAAFAEQYNLAFDADGYLWESVGILTWASMEEIEFYARLDDVKWIRFAHVAHNEDPDAWKDKVDWTNKDAAGVYDAETDTYAIGITVRDIHSVGQKNANEAFAETYGFEYKYPVSTYLFQKRATMEEIEMFARLEEVESVVFSLPPVFS